MATVPIGIAAAKAIAKKSEELRKKAGRALYSAGLRGVQVLQTQLIPAAVPKPVDRGVYRAGWRCDPLMREGGDINGAEIYNVEPTAALIEKGVRAENIKIGRAMIDALAEWVLRKGIVSKKVTKKRSKSMVANEARQAAWAIAVSLKRKGIFKEGQGFRFLETLMTKRMPDIVTAEISRALKSK